MRSRKRLMLGGKLVILGAAIPALLADSCSTQAGTPAGSSTTPSAAAAKNAALGQAIHVTDKTNGLSAFVTAESVKYPNVGTGVLAEAPANGVYAVLDVLIAVDSGSYDFNPLYFKYEEPDGTTYTTFSGNSITAGFDPTLTSGSLGSGQKTRGNIVYDVKSKGGVLQVTDPLFTVVGQWSLPTS